MALNSSVVMLGLEDLDFSNMDLILHLNSMPKVCGSLETTDSTAHTVSRFKCGRVALSQFLLHIFLLALCRLSLVSGV
jgi:hypothetical protein